MAETTIGKWQTVVVITEFTKESLIVLIAEHFVYLFHYNFTLFSLPMDKLDI